MTAGQARWLQEHPEYQIVGAGGAVPGGGSNMAPGNSGFESMGALEPDGTFKPGVRPQPPAVLVGVRKVPSIPGGPLRRD